MSDLDLDPIPLVLKLDLHRYVVKMYYDTKTKVSVSEHSNGRAQTTLPSRTCGW